MNYSAALSYLESLTRFGIKPGLERMERLLAKLGNPEKQLACLHITGTNGKGSVNRMLYSIFTQAGYKAGSFTSPHLEKYNERIHIGGHDITDEKFARAVSAVKKAEEDADMRDDPPTQFEILTAAALLVFAEENVDFAIIEVGMGGLLDSTNIIQPLCCVITNVTYDHMERCGNTIEEIAAQKAGIIKKGVPVVTAAEGVALAAIVDKAASVKAELYVWHKDFISVPMNGDLFYQDFFYRQGTYTDHFTVSLGGDHQTSNAALAVMTARLLAPQYPSLTNEKIKQGLLAVQWPGRLEKIADTPEMILDGAHNIAGAVALRFALHKYRPGRNVIFLLGVMRDKDIRGIMDELLQDGDILIAAPADGSARAAEPELLASLTARPSEVFYELTPAIARARQLAGAGGIVVIAGSLYLLGQVKGMWGKCN